MNPKIKVQEVIASLVNTNAEVATKYVSPTEIIRAKRRTYGAGNKKKFNNRSIEISLHIGKPNYRERKFIKDLQKVGEKFPVKKVQLKFITKK